MSDKIKRLISINIALVLIIDIIVPVQAQSLPPTFTGPERETLRL